MVVSTWTGLLVVLSVITLVVLPYLLCKEIESLHDVSWICELVCKNITLSLNRQFFQIGERGPSDASDLVICCATHDPAYKKIEKHCEHNAVLPNTSLEFKQNVIITSTAGNVAKEASDVLN